MTTHDHDSSTPLSADEIEADIEATRERLGATIDELGDKMNVKKQARAHQQGLSVAGGVAGAVVLLVVGLVVWRRRR